MAFNLNEVIEILERSPKVLEHYLSGLSEGWLKCNEGTGTWTPAEVIGHLIDGEKYNFIPRLEIILKETENKTFPAFDRFSHLKNYENMSIEDKLLEFSKLRMENIEKLKVLARDDSQLDLTGIHPEYGEVTARQLISTWAVHDLTHIAQITRVLAHKYEEAVGPWKGYLGILKK